jgi:hypothetical protein
MAMRVVDNAARLIDYRLNILGIRVWEDACQRISRSGQEWGTMGPRRDLPVHVPQNADELKTAAADTLRLTAYQYNAERPGSDLVEVLGKTKDFESALIDGEDAVAAGDLPRVLRGPLAFEKRPPLYVAACAG